MKWKIPLAGIIFILTVSFCNAQNAAIDEQKYIKVEGIEQWITIKGEDRSNPVIFLLHGGPGSPSSPFSEAIFGDWEKDFILVNWDQRGTGRTFGRSAPEEVDENYWIQNPLTLEQMTADGIAVSEYLCQYLRKDKIILFGTSWGSILGVKMAIKRSDLYHAYMGHAQLVNPSEDLIQVFHKTNQLAHERNDSTAIELLRSFGPPPYHQAKQLGQLLRIIKEYEYENSIPAPAYWWEIPPAYDNETDELHRYNGDDYSFLYYAGHKPLGIKGMNTAVNFMEDGRKFNIPVYLVQGEEDILTPLAITVKYFEKIEAPDKKLVVVPATAHGFNQPVIDAVYTLLSEKILPPIQNKNRGHK